MSAATPQGGKGKYMKPVVVRNVRIGDGRPKICVPIVAVTAEAILEEAAHILSLPADVVEWRVDWYEDVENTEKVLETAGKLREVLGEVPLLFTFRTLKEGGQKSLGPEAYAALNLAAAESGQVDLIDVEVFTGDEIVKQIIEGAHRCGVKVIASNHDFHKTPSKEELLARLCKMQDLGADIPKIAVMPQFKKDVLTLLATTLEMQETYAKGPIITMSMAEQGVVSRLCGETFGSALTFGAARQASAPGQIGVEDLKTVLDIIHKSIS